MLFYQCYFFLVLFFGGNYRKVAKGERRLNHFENKVNQRFIPTKGYTNTFDISSKQNFRAVNFSNKNFDHQN